MLATRISFMNEMALLAEKLGAHIDAVRRGIGRDSRIGRHFLYAGCGYGGSCFPKHLRAIRKTAAQVGTPVRVLAAVEAANAHQKTILVDRIVARFGDDLAERTSAVWGLAFKPGTDDVREAPSAAVLGALAERGARVRAYDPVAADEARRAFVGAVDVELVARADDALASADALVIVPEWKEFRSPDFERMKDFTRQPVIFDGRNILEPRDARAAGFEYTGIGRA